MSAFRISTAAATTITTAIAIAAAALALLPACFASAAAPCESDLACDRLPDGACLGDRATGPRWCAYPDAECTSGYRYSELDVGDDAAGRCTAPLLIPACATDADCASGVCLETGACALRESVLYVAPAGAAAGLCTPDAPCDLAYARARATRARASLRLLDGEHALPTAWLVEPPLAHLTLVGGPRTVVRAAAAGPAFEVRGGSALALRGLGLATGVACEGAALELARADLAAPGVGAGREGEPWVRATGCDVVVRASRLAGARADAIRAIGGSVLVERSTLERSSRAGLHAEGGAITVVESIIRGNVARGIDAVGASRLAVERSRITGNFEGGISSVGGPFAIANNIVSGNGNPVYAAFGGIRAESAAPGNRLVHNTIVWNDSDPRATPALAGGLHCRAAGTFANNLVAANLRGDHEHPAAQVGGTCELAGSIVRARDTGLGLVPLEYTLAGAGSPAIDAGVVLAAPEAVDLGGQPRSDGRPDAGADEYWP